MKDKNYTIAKSDDGSMQITFIIPFDDIKKAKDEAAVEIGKDTEIPGFRKGNAPLEKLLAHIPQSKLFETALSKILPKLFSSVIENENIKPIAFPKFELIKTEEGKDWEIVAKTAELVDFELGDYKQIAIDSFSGNKIWKPGDSKEAQKPMSLEEKEQAVINALIQNIKVKVPSILIDEEVEARLSRLLSQIDKLGLTLDSYLSSIGKKIEDIRLEYKKIAEDTIALDLILIAIAQKENIKVEEKDVDEALKASFAKTELDPQVNTQQNRKLVENILFKRFALQKLIS